VAKRIAPSNVARVLSGVEAEWLVGMST